jgi:hypothetical protein
MTKGRGTLSSNDLVRMVVSRAKDLVPRVHSLGLYNVKSVCSCEILQFVQNDKVELGPLIPPFLGLFATVEPAHMLSLVIYTIVLVYSGLLSLYYLFIDPRTRGWAIQSANQASSGLGGPAISGPPARR